ncbi:type VI secretion system-associated protein TagO [Burkholderia contaminans]|uniref:type VI secretion system-associated protein VasI n=1 Tax=Burkholderia contaminans TaxID=488447 RepID=UPI001CF1FA55|nr:type VI secretion system-associated protein VasI [Burkholderia contaminans]MCA7918762.1 type VI secretion system-associated protein TagO [Burkholderia contaminans]UUX35759.1 type VI secretion system-associated protein TagO [Burkholderia contaminans]
MRVVSAMLACAIITTGCDAGSPVAATGKSCTALTSPSERLACFDTAAGTPPIPAVASAPRPGSATGGASPSATAAELPAFVAWVRRSEADRAPSDAGFRLVRTEDTLPGQWRVLITARPLGHAEPHAYLAISCLSNISRLQLLAHQPIEPNRVNVRLLLDGKPISSTVPWQVLEDGSVVDAGRGLVAIEQLRYLVRPASQLQVESDDPTFSGWTFDATALHSLMKQQREACHW